ncbi:MAG TPA: VLRF1 family aeRF1-type release factor [Nitrospiraceae bacterium]|nr:VLRF1 family aeRF1-type release factor [Nitrospiraceae bacterium]
MLDAHVISVLPKLPPPILTVYLDTNPANPRNQRWPSGARIWLKARAQAVRAGMARQEEKLFQKQVERVDRFLEKRAKRERGIAMYAGPQAWHVLRLQVAVDDELQWGRASLKQLLWLLDEHQACGVVVVDHSGARFYRFWMGEVEEQKTARFQVHTSQWRKKRLVRPGRPAKQKTFSAHKDAFEQRLAAQYAKIFRETATRTERWARNEKFDTVFLAGSDEAVERVWRDLSQNFRERASAVKGDYARLSAGQLQERIFPAIEKWKRARESEQVKELLANRDRARSVRGIDDTLTALQDGRVEKLFVSRGIRGRLRQCTSCGRADRSADRVCAYCGDERRVVTLREILPDLARKFGTSVEVVAGPAAAKLKAAGGLAAWLRS